jgi:hypothetical protein
MGEVYQSCWRIYLEIIFFFQFRISHVLRFISIYDLFTDSPSYIYIFFSIAPRPVLRPTQSSIQLVQRSLSPDVNNWGLKLAIHFHLVPVPRTVELYLHSPYVFMA